LKFTLSKSDINYPLYTSPKPPKPTTKMTQHVIQAGLAMGMSATEGIHKLDPNLAKPALTTIGSLTPQNFIPSPSSRILLRGKKGDIQAPIMNIGAWSWGDTATFDWKPEQFEELKQAWPILQSSGVNWIDTAPIYGDGESERLCGRLVVGLPRDSFIMQTKWSVLPTPEPVFPKDSPLVMLKESLERMRLDYVDVYLVHGPIHPQSFSVVAKGLAECVDQDLTKTIGVANYNKEEMIELANELDKYGIPIALNQCEFSLLRRYPETHGLIQACQERGIIFQSYSSLGVGRLTGKYTTENPPPRTYRFAAYDMKDIEPVQEALQHIGRARGKSMAAVALNYNICKGAVPTVGLRSAQQAESNVEALGWRLTEDEVMTLDRVSLEGKATILWQHG